MKLVQSTWFKTYDSIQGNWPDEKFALFSIALSHHLLKKQGLPMLLNTNSIGFDILIERLGLEYHEVDLCLENSQTEPEIQELFDRYWVMKKLYAYSLQEDPFIHFDNDVYFYKKLDKTWNDAALIAQNQEMNLPYYTKSFELIRKHFTYIPKYFNVEPQNILAVNAGIIGGTQFKFFKLLYLEVIEFLMRNRSHLHYLPEEFANIFIEQCIVRNLAGCYNIPFKYVLHETIGASKKYGVNQFHQVPDKADYIHVMNYKSNPTICESIARTLYFTDKKLYNHCIHVAKSIRDTHKSAQMPSPVKTINDPSMKLKYFFRRTGRVCALVTSATLNFDTIEKLGDSVERTGSSLTERQFSVVQDVFTFELNRYRFFENLNKDYASDLYSNFVNFQSALREEKWMDLYLSRSESTRLIESQWNWVECNEFLDIPADEYLNNLKLEPGYFATLIYYYPEQHVPKEHPLDVIDTLIVKLTKNNMTVRDLIATIQNLLKEQDHTTKSEEILARRIRFLLFQGALVVNVQQVQTA